MEENKVANEESNVSMEQLIEVCNKMSYQNNMLAKRNQELEQQLQSINRIDYLFKILKHEGLFDYETTEKCIKEITTALFGEEKTNNEETE